MIPTGTETDAATQALEALKEVTAALISALPHLPEARKEGARLAIASAVAVFQDS